MAEKRSQYEKVLRLGEKLCSSSCHDPEKERVRKQLNTVGSLWEEVCKSTSTRLDNTIKAIEHLARFNDVQNSLSDWLEQFEDRVTSQIEEAMMKSPYEQANALAKVCHVT